MIDSWPTAGEPPDCSGVLRSRPQDFQVYEQLGFDLSGEGEHVFLHLQKRELNSMELLERIARLSAIPVRDIGMSGQKDRNAVTQQWYSVRMAGRPEPDWSALEQSGDVKLLQSGRHSRKLKRGVHRANRFVLRLRELSGERDHLIRRLEQVKREGVPNYFGEQRFGRGGSTLLQAGRWLQSGGRKISRTKRSLFLSALRAYLFNVQLANRVASNNWNRIVDGDVCILQGSRSLFCCDNADEGIQARAEGGDIHPGLPLWGVGEPLASQARASQQAEILARHSLPLRDGPALGGEDVCRFLERMGLSLSYRPARVLPDDFCWQFCDDDSLQLDFSLATGSFATAVLAELLNYNELKRNRGKSDSSE